MQKPTPCPHVTDPDVLAMMAVWNLTCARCWWDVQREWAANPWSQRDKETDACED